MEEGMRKIDEAVSDIKSILNNIERTEECCGETLVDIDELCDEILAISCRSQKTNADRIRAMSDEELAELLERVEIEGYNDSSLTPKMENGYHMGILQWLKSEAKE